MTSNLLEKVEVQENRPLLPKTNKNMLITFAATFLSLLYIQNRFRLSRDSTKNSPWTSVIALLRSLLGSFSNIQDGDGREKRSNYFTQNYAREMQNYASLKSCIMCEVDIHHACTLPALSNIELKIENQQIKRRNINIFFNNLIKHTLKSKYKSSHKLTFRLNLVIFLNNNQIQTLISILDLKHAKLRNKIKIKSRLRKKQKTTVSNSIYTEIKDQTEKRLRHTHINSNNLAINSINKSNNKVKFKLPSDNISHNYNKNLSTNSINDRQIDYETSETSRRSYSLRTVSETSTKNTSYKNMLKENFKNNSSSRYLGRRKSESCAVIATSQSVKRFMDDEDDAISYLNGQPLKKHDSTHSAQLLNNLSVTRPLRGAVASKAKENRLAEYTKKNITDTQDKVEVDRRVEARINELKASKTPYKRADIIKEVKDSFRKEKWPVPSPKPTQSEKGCSDEKNQSTGFAQSTPKMLHKPVSETKQQNYRHGKEETEDDSESSSSDEESESSANTSASQQDMEVASETYIGITDDDITMLKTLASSQRNLGDDWTEIMQKLETNKLDDLNDEQSDMLKEKIIELRLSAQKANLLELVSKLTLEQMAETAAELGKVGLNDLADLCDKKLYCEMTIEQLQLLLSTFNGSKLGPEYVETRNKLFDKLNNLSPLDKELLTSLLDNTTMRLNHGKELQQLHENNLTSVENEALTRLVNLTAKLPDLHKTNEDNKKKILLQIKKHKNRYYRGSNHSNSTPYDA
jgi:hypothetical protein